MKLSWLRDLVGPYAGPLDRGVHADRGLAALVALDAEIALVLIQREHRAAGEGRLRCLEQSEVLLVSVAGDALHRLCRAGGDGGAVLEVHGEADVGVTPNALLGNLALDVPVTPCLVSRGEVAGVIPLGLAEAQPGPASPADR